jgi:hypothetical protein
MLAVRMTQQLKRNRVARKMHPVVSIQRKDNKIN